MDEFEKINSQTGTRIYIYNLIQFKFKKEIEFRKNKNKCDIFYTYFGEKMASNEKNEERYTSLREYLSYIFYKPDMLIFIQNDRVHTKYLEKLLFKPKIYECEDKIFKISPSDLIPNLEENLIFKKSPIKKF